MTWLAPHGAAARSRVGVTDVCPTPGKIAAPVRVDSAAGVIIAAPRPWAGRVPVSIAALAARRPASEDSPDSPDSTVPATSIRRPPTGRRHGRLASGSRGGPD